MISWVFNEFKIWRVFISKIDISLKYAFLNGNIFDEFFFSNSRKNTNVIHNI